MKPSGGPSPIRLASSKGSTTTSPTRPGLLPRADRSWSGRRRNGRPRVVDGDLPEPEAAPGLRRITRQRSALGLRERRGQREDERLGRVVRDGAGAEVVLLMDVPVEDGHVLPVLQQIDGLAAVFRGPVPLRGQVEERPVGEYDDGRGGGQRPEVREEPVELRLADGRLRVGDVVEHGEGNPFVGKREGRGAE